MTFNISKRIGFTFVEALLALSLSIVLMTATFTALHQYAFLEQRSSNQVQEAQIALAVMRDLENDLQRIASEFLEQRAAMGSKSADQATFESTIIAPYLDQNRVSQFGEKLIQLDSIDQQPVVFSGTESQLVLTAVGGNPRFQGYREVRLSETDLPLETIVWCVGFGKPIHAMLRNRNGQLHQSVLRETSGHTGLLRLVKPVVNNSSPSTLDVIEVISSVHQLRFRYFDGLLWHKQWNVLRSKRLPNAIEVQLSFADSPDQYRWVIPIAAHQSELPS